MLKYLRIPVTVLSLTACVLLVALWVRSYWWSDHAYCPLPSSNILVVNSWRGRLNTYAGEQPGAFPYGWGTMSRYVANVAGRNQSRRSWGYKSDQQSREFLFPHWLPVFIFAVLAAAVNIRLPWRFSLRTLLIVTALIAMALGLLTAL